MSGIPHQRVSGAGSGFRKLWKAVQLSGAWAIDLGAGRICSHHGEPHLDFNRLIPSAGNGTPGRIRTCDRLLRRQLLCPLSYGGALHFRIYAREGARTQAGGRRLVKDAPRWPNQARLILRPPTRRVVGRSRRRASRIGLQWSATGPPWALEPVARKTSIQGIVSSRVSSVSSCQARILPARSLTRSACAALLYRLFISCGSVLRS